MTLPISNCDERPEDILAIRQLNISAFGQEQKAGIVDALRKNRAILLSLVACIGQSVVGHILYSPDTLECKDSQLVGAGLGPMAVAPNHQRQEIGGNLVKTGNQRLRDSGYRFIVVLRHPAYYPRFGYRPAQNCKIRCEWDVPNAVFMVSILDRVVMRGVSGLARYRPEFSCA
jgi:putative acetyltransferase